MPGPEKGRVTAPMMLCNGNEWQISNIELVAMNK